MSHDKLNIKVLVGLISHNRFDFTKVALETLQNTNMPFDLLIVDNGSEVDTKRELGELAIKYGANFVSIENRNCNGARDMINHYGLTYDYVIYVDNDAIMPEMWLEKLLEYGKSTNAALLGVSQSDFGSEETFFGEMVIEDKFVKFENMYKEITEPEKVGWVTGHCLTVNGNFLRTIWSKYRLWERRLKFPIDLDDIDLMMMARELGLSVYVAPLVVPQNRDFTSEFESNRYNAARNDFHNYALSCVSFWSEWKLNPMLNWNCGYTGNAHKSGYISDADLKCEFNKMVEMLKPKSEEIYSSFRLKLDA